ncbi:MAG: hypothetical protein WCC38_16995 [Pseudonocardiaceae bacterium]
MSDVVSCPTCELPAIVEDRFHLPSTHGPVEHLRISCIGRHCWLLLAEHVTHVALYDYVDIPVDPDRSV